VSTASWRLRSPEWDTLTALLDDLCREKGLLKRGSQPSYQPLGEACGLNPDILSAWRRRQSRPSRAMLAKVAQYAGQPLSLWLRAGGFEEMEQVG
jgi:transcriptional regulator with XRE-family HTH domain